jgi:MFS family permease
VSEQTSNSVVTPWKKIYVLAIAGALSWMGSGLTTFAVILRDKDNVGPIGISTYLLAFSIPSILMAPIEGLIVDKYSSRQIIPLAALVMGASSFSLAFGFPHWWTLVALFITACCGTFMGTAFQAMQVSVTAPDDIPRVTGLLQSFSSAGTLVAPALGALLVASTGYFWPFVIDAITFWLLGVVFLLLGLNRKPVPHIEGQKLKAMDGVKFVFSDDLLRSIMVLLATLIVTLGAVNVGEVFLLKDELNASDLVYGLAGAIFSTGSILGALGTAALKLPARRHAAAMLSAIAALIGVVFGFSISWHWSVVLVLSFVAGLGNSVLNAYAIGIVMRRAPKEALGRVNAALNAIIQTGSVSAIVIGGFAIAAFGVREVFLVGAILGTIVFAIFAPAVFKYGRLHGASAESESDAQEKAESK